ncbi:MAG: MFS transporter [Acetobacteraceae bacterium]|nr:MFS transporter [Acetobacteraceae bacterium]MSP29706.1 MFS transporter [Acetobacteraceae bacterium]
MITVPSPTSPPWLAALLVASLIQMVGSFMSQSMPVIAPLLTATVGVPGERVGTLYALTSFGSILFMAFGAPIISRVGPVAALGASVICAGFSLLLVTAGSWPVAMLAAGLLGLSYGPVPPGSTRLLGATAPARHRGFIFSIKQAGAQLGGVLAGILLAPLAAHAGWEVALLTAASAGIFAGIGTLAYRKRLDIARDPSRSIHPLVLFHGRNLRAPFAAIAADPRLIALTVLTTAFATAQGCLFSFCVTFLTSIHGATLVQAGYAYACMQGGALVGRLVLGFWADRAGDTMRNILGQAWACAVLILMWATLPLPTGAIYVLVLAFMVGVMAASWNGLVLSEIARIAPPERVVEAASGSTMVSFGGYVLGPALFSIAVSGFGGWFVPYMLVAAQLALTALILPFWLRRQ